MSVISRKHGIGMRAEESKSSMILVTSPCDHSVFLHSFLCTDKVKLHLIFIGARSFYAFC